MSLIPIVIPAYEPDERFITLLQDFRAQGIGPVIVVDDGSGPSYRELFKSVARLINAHHDDGGTLLVHEVNRGKGAALKTAFRFVLDHYPNAIGVVTADSDGQHTPACIQRVAQVLDEDPETLVLGARTFDGEDVPWKSRAGNHITRWVFARLTGLAITDTQTGLRGIPRPLMEACLELSGDRFEFETQMLICAHGMVPVREVPIKTVYDSKDDHQTHFNTVTDSLRIYRILFREPLTFALSSVASCVLDITLFGILCRVLWGFRGYVALATVLARLCSATFNFLINSRVVFKSTRKASVSGPRYVILAGVLLVLSATFTTLGTRLFPFLPEVVVKIVVDGTLFVLSFFVQKRAVF